MSDVEDLIKAGVILVIGAIIFSGIGVSTQLSKSFTDLGIFLIIMALIIALLTFLIPFLKDLLGRT